jgi:hypothetical protein
VTLFVEPGGMPVMPYDEVDDIGLLSRGGAEA